jgi:hypothetical protein
VGRTYKYGDDVRDTLEAMEKITITDPADPGTTPTRTALKRWD